MRIKATTATKAAKRTTRGAAEAALQTQWAEQVEPLATRLQVRAVWRTLARTTTLACPTCKGLT
jgi:hypothetical protein